MKINIINSLENLSVHDHLCLIYETQEEQFASVIPFMSIGLKRGEKCIYIADENTGSQVIDAMKSYGIDTGKYLLSRQLAVITKQESYLKNGFFDPDGMIDVLKESVNIALGEGFSALRVTGEMTWALCGDPGVERLIEYEAKLNDFFPYFDALAVCQYNLKRFSADIITNVIRTHPTVIFKDTVCKNFYYIPTEEFLKPGRKEMEVKRLLSNILDREKQEINLLKSKKELELKNKELRDTQEKLIRQEKLAVTGQLAGSVGHELRNPLGVINNAIYYLNMVLEDSPDCVKEYLNIISSEVQRSERIISDLLNFSRIEPVTFSEKIFFPDFMEEVMKRRTFDETIKIINRNIDYTICADRTHMVQIMENLIINACQAMPEGGDILIEGKKEGDFLHISIIDTGCGIKPEHIEKIFEPLFTTKSRGIGLGLAVTKKLVEVNGGTIKVESNGRKGSVFTLIFPGGEQ
ncbi:MAG: MEDS domain-containing protein [Candidatus Eremiobacterota bacterium]